MKLALVMPLIAVVLTSACVSQNGAETGGPGEQEPGVAEFSVVIQHTAYQPNEFRVKMGDTVKFSLLAASGTERHKHGITIDEYNINQVVESSLNPVTVEFSANRKGEFRIWCSTCWDGPFGNSHPPIEAKLIVE